MDHQRSDSSIEEIVHVSEGSQFMKMLQECY